ncbi:hypothetical protein DFH29DRAFT_171398 [Suillus ampliporus]|nr:hypothetical protein DFH29DRAFT_171398 [Suillus ampliporus]
MGRSDDSISFRNTHPIVHVAGAQHGSSANGASFSSDHFAFAGIRAVEVNLYYRAAVLSLSVFQGTLEPISTSISLAHVTIHSLGTQFYLLASSVIQALQESVRLLNFPVVFRMETSFLKILCSRRRTQRFSRLATLLLYIPRHCMEDTTLLRGMREMPLISHSSGMRFLLASAMAQVQAALQMTITGWMLVHLLKFQVIFRTDIL